MVSIEILHKEGGVFIAAECECLKPEMFEALHKTYDFYAGVASLDRSATLNVSNALIASVPGHPILKAYREQIQKQANTSCQRTFNDSASFFTKIVLGHMNIAHKDILFPPTLFYPLPPEIKIDPLSVVDLKTRFIKPESIAIYWKKIEDLQVSPKAAKKAEGPAFFASLGKQSRLFRPFYAQLMKHLKHPNSHWFSYLRPGSDPEKMLSTLEGIYTINISLLYEPQKALRIPKIIHQIWVGNKPLPEKYKHWQKTWQSLPGWQYKLWTDKEVENFPLINQTLYYQEKNMGARADLLRIEILYKEGGLYVDTDFECIKPEMFDVLNHAYDFYCGLTPLDCKKFVINNAIIGSIPGHPVLKGCIENAALQKPTLTYEGGQIVMKGPGLLTAMILEHANKNYKDIVLPPTFFYPLGVKKLRTKYRKSPYALEAVKKKSIETRNNSYPLVGWKLDIARCYTVK